MMAHFSPNFPSGLQTNLLRICGIRPYPGLPFFNLLNPEFSAEGQVAIFALSIKKNI